MGYSAAMPAGQSLNPDKARRAAKHPKRPGELCRAEPGVWVPDVDLRRCEGKGDCVEVCPHGVFEVGQVERSAYEALPWFARFKLKVHGLKVAHTPHADACQACGLCVVACPEHALRLVRR